MMPTNTLVITGGTTGIGAAIVKACAAQNYQIAFNGSRSPEKIDDPILRDLPQSVYVQGDAGDPATAAKLRTTAHQRFGSDLGKLVVIANAGIEKLDTDPEGVEKMKKVNVGGAESLLREFRDLLSARPDEALFIGVSSIVATLNIVLPSNSAYQTTKVEVERLADTARQLFSPIPAIALSPGAIRTSMTESSPVYGILLRMAAITAVGDHDLRHILAKVAGGDEKLGQTPAETFLNLLGEEALNSATDTKAVKILKTVLAKDSSMKDMKAQLLAVKAAQDPVLRERMATVLTEADILVSPETVARKVMEEIETRRTLREGGVLHAWQAGKVTPAPIARLFMAARGV